ncbi:MAG: PLP-dependent aspartate aminotransferase family protein [Clostridium sp.]
MDNKDYGLDTRAIHGGKKGHFPNYSLNPPIFQTSTFVFEDLEHVEDVMSFKSDDYVYTRGNNPTLRLLEEKMACLEGGSGAVAFSSGMAAISSVIFSLCRSGDRIITHRTLYGSSYNVATKVAPKFDIHSSMIDLTNLESLLEEMDESVKVIYFETPSNPNLEIIDIEKVSEIAKKYSAKVVVDNTFASPYIQNPLNLGADVVVHSATKYICGHGDVVGGVAVSKDIDYINELKFDYMCEFGGVMSPFNAWLLIRGLKTLGLRMERHMENAMAVAKFLESHPKVENVMYPGLEGFSGHETAKKQMKGFGGIVSFELKDEFNQINNFIKELNLHQLAVSLGDCESLIQHPASMTHRGYPNDKLQEFGFSQKTIRISCGIENVRDIIDDLEKSLNKL